MTKKLNLFVGKIWQTKKHALCFQIKDPKKEKKNFLIINTLSKKTPISLSQKKSSDIVNQGNIASLLRKHLEGKILSSIIKEETPDPEIWFLFKERGKEEISYFIKIIENPLLECSLISSERKTLFRYGKKGTFTHIKEYQDSFVEEKTAKDIYEDLLENQDSKEQISSHENEKTTPNKELKNKLKRRFKTLKNSHEKILSERVTPENLEKERAHLGHLKGNLYLLKRGESSVTILKDHTGLDHDLTFELDPSLSPGKNLSQLFMSLEKKERGYKHTEKRLVDSEKTLEKIKKDLEDLESRDYSEEETNNLLSYYKIKKQEKISKSNQKRESKPYKLFIDKNQVKYYVGKTAEDNDKLVKKAKSNDLWFHVSGTRGSHVIVPNQGIKKNMPLEFIKNYAGLLAIHYSKAKSDMRGEVYFSKRHLIKKQKNQAPGLWTVLKSESFYVSFTQKDLKQALNQMVDF